MEDRLGEIKESINTLDKKILDLEAERDKHYDEMERVRRSRLEKLIGMCFRMSDGKAFKIIGLDKDEVTLVRRHWNPYRMWAVMILKKPESPNRCITISEERIYTTASDFDDPVAEIRSEYTEISKADFEILWNKAMEDLSGKVIGG
jgi:hypothetical protein